MDSSPDLSLKLRRGSSDSRDSFYMDFAQGIDSDIEEVNTIIAQPPMTDQQVEQAQQAQVQPQPQPQPQTQPQSQIQPQSQPLQQQPQPQTPVPVATPSPTITPVSKSVMVTTPKSPPHRIPSEESDSESGEGPPTPPPPPPPPPPPLAYSQLTMPELPRLPQSPPDSPLIFSKHRILAAGSPVQAIADSEELKVAGHSPLQFAAGMLGKAGDDDSAIGTSPIPPTVPSTLHIPIGELPDDLSSHLVDDTSSLGIPLPPTPVSFDESTVMELPPQHAPSPISSGNILVSSETASHNSSPAKSSRVHSASHSHRVTIDESKLPLSTSSTHHQLVTIATGPPSASSSTHQHMGGTPGGGSSHGGHLALMYHTHHHHHLNYPMLSLPKRPSRLPEPRYQPVKEIRAGDALATTFSALYGKLLVVMGIAFPMAEVISTYIPPSFYEGFYLYLYIGSMLFLFFMYATLLWGRPKLISDVGKSPKQPSKRSSTTSASESMEESDTESCDAKPVPTTIPARRPSLLAPLGRQHHYGSFYLRMGAVAFGIGSMIYSGLEFGQYFELERDTKCHNVMLALTPATRMAFIFIQMYFIFLNNEQIKVYRHKILARFGLMHMIGTNLSVWLNVLIQETKHEILTFYNPENRTLRISHRLGNRMQNLEQSAHLRVSRGLKGPYQLFECRRTNIIGTLVQDASPFLFPCTIEYSLICAAILYVMWRSISRPQSEPPIRVECGLSPCKRSPHHYSVDCARAHKGLFIGILILVLTIISLILFFVLISRPEFVSVAVTEVTICELTIYATATIATLIGMVQVRHLQYDAARSFELDDILLVGAQTGLFLYSTFTVIGGHFTLRNDTILVLVTALASIVQTAFQTMFILDASRRQAVSPEHMRKKPGREIVTFLLVANLAMWAISTLEKSRAESHPIQLNFYGLWAWTIITHVSMPLAIFYRFHSTVCLCEIWKRAYKLKPAYM